jgi:F0F1-type ATP synthase assembly protein I
LQNSDYIKERLNTLREYLRFSFLVLLALLSGIITNFYQVVSHSKPLYTIVFSVIGFVLFGIILLIIKRLLFEIDDTLKELNG